MKNPFADEDEDEEKQMPPNPFDDDDDVDEDDISIRFVHSPTYSPLSPNADSTQLARNANNNTSATRPSTQEVTPTLNPKRHKFREIMNSVDRKMKKRGFGNTIICVDETNENKIIRFLLSDRVFGYPGSDGTWSSNYKYYVFNNHPALSLVVSHPMNPYSKKSRFIVFLCLVMFGITLSFVFWDTDYVPKLSMCREGCGSMSLFNDTFPEANIISTDVDYVYRNLANSSAGDYCVGGYNDGITRAHWNRNCQYFRSWMVDAAIGAVLVPYSTFLRFLATCGCLRGRNFYQSNFFGSLCSRFIDSLGGMALTTISGVHVILVLWSLYECYVRHIGFTVFKTLIVSKLWSMVEWFIWAMPYFSYRYPIDKRYFYKRLEKKQANYLRTQTSETGIAMTEISQSKQVGNIK